MSLHASDTHDNALDHDLQDDPIDQEQHEYHELLRYGLVDDCAAFHAMHQYARAVVGCTLYAARLLRPKQHDRGGSDTDDDQESDSDDDMFTWSTDDDDDDADQQQATDDGSNSDNDSDGSEYTAIATRRCGTVQREQHYDVAIAWDGGRHHGNKAKASGFCFCNDIVIGILYLRRFYRRILYVDMDVHHADAVEQAFESTNGVCCVSFHRKVAGFFPGTGSVADIGSGKGKYYSINCPYQGVIDNAWFQHAFQQVVGGVMQRYQAQVIVMQCGADALAGDPLGDDTNLALHTYHKVCAELLVEPAD
jgi:acetoin utilization deacetylase AcuC-like enzyme